MCADPSPHTLHKVPTSHPQKIWGEGVGEEGLAGAKSYSMGLPLFFGLSPQATNRQEKQDHLHPHTHILFPKGSQGLKCKAITRIHRWTRKDFLQDVKPALIGARGRQQGAGVGHPDWGQSWLFLSMGLSSVDCFLA